MLQNKKKWNVKRGKLATENLCGTQRKSITAVHSIYWGSIMETEPGPEVQLWMSMLQTMLQKQGGRSLKCSSLQKEEWQCAWKACAVLMICAPFHSSVTVSVRAYQLRRLAGFLSSKHLNNLTIRGQIALNSVTLGL